SSDIWVGITTTTPNLHVWHYNGASWTSSLSTYGYYGSIIVGLSTPSKVAVVYGWLGGQLTSAYVTTTSNGGGSWSSPVASPSQYCFLQSSVTSIGDTVHFVGEYCYVDFFLRSHT